MVSNRKNMFRYIVLNLTFYFKDLSKNILKALFSSFGILFLISFMVLYLSLRQSVKDYIGQKLFGTLDINEIVIHPKTKPGHDVFASKENTFTESLVESIRGMKEFSDVYSLTKINYTTRIRVGMFGYYQVQRVPVFGIDAGYFRNRNSRWKEFVNREPVPVIIPKIGLQLVNTYTAQMGLPQLTEQQLVGFAGSIIISTVNPQGKEMMHEIPGVLHSLSGEIDFPGIVVPSTFVFEFCRKHRMDEGYEVKGYSYIRMFARVKDIKTLPDTTRKLERMGLQVESQSAISQKTNKAMTILDGMFFLLGAVLGLLTIISIFNSYLVIVYNRSYDISLKRVIGVSKLRVIAGFVFEAAFIGAILGVVGYFAGSYLTHLLSSRIAEWIPALKGLELKPVKENLLAYSVVLSIVISSCSALIPAIFASNKNLFRTMGK